MSRFRFRPRLAVVAVALAAVTLVSACGGGGRGDALTPSTDPSPSGGADGPADAPSAFSIDDVEPVAALEGEFPFFAIPDGYENPNSDIPVAQQARVPMWTGDRLEWVEGTVYQSLIHAEDGHAFTPTELRNELDAMIVDRAGGVLVTDSAISDAALNEIDDETAVTYVDGIGDIWNSTARTYVVRTEWSVVWIHFCTTSASASWMIAEQRL